MAQAHFPLGHSFNNMEDPSPPSPSLSPLLPPSLPSAPSRGGAWNVAPLCDFAHFEVVGGITSQSVGYQMWYQMKNLIW